jgi:ankyrin repeat protein
LNGHTEAAAFLLRQNAVPNIRSIGSLYTPLHLATLNQHVPLVAAFVDAGADFSIPDANGQSAKTLAENTKNHELIFCFDPAARKSFRMYCCVMHQVALSLAARLSRFEL